MIASPSDDQVEGKTVVMLTLAGGSGWKVREAALPSFVEHFLGLVAAEDTRDYRVELVVFSDGEQIIRIGNQPGL